MYQFAAKSQSQSEKSKTDTTTANKSNMRTGIKMPVQTRSLFSPSFNQENDSEKSNLNNIFHPIQLMPLPHSLLQPEYKRGELHPVSTNLSQKQNQLAPEITRPNNTGIPLQMKEIYESASGFSFDDVKVHYNSDKPAQLQALAYTQGNQVYIGAGQEKHLGHELGHVVQQKQGRVALTHLKQGKAVNFDPALEHEADMAALTERKSEVRQLRSSQTAQPIIQCCYLCNQPACLYGEGCGNPTVANGIMTRHANSLARTFAVARASVLANTPYNANSFRVGGQNLSFAGDRPPLTRYNFHAGVKAAAVANHPTYNDGNGDLYPCPYCGWDYPIDAMHIDHIVPWADYAKSLAGNQNIATCEAWKVYVACNDTLNLTLACKHCNESKSDQTLTQAWIDGKRAAAAVTGGFQW